MQIEIKKIDELIPAPYNPRKISNKDYERLKHSIKEFGRVSTLTEAKKEAYKVIFNAPIGTQITGEMGISEHFRDNVYEIVSYRGGKGIRLMNGENYSSFTRGYKLSNYRSLHNVFSAASELVVHYPKGTR